MTLKIHLLPLSFSLSYQDLINCYCDCHTGLEGALLLLPRLSCIVRMTVFFCLELSFNSPGCYSLNITGCFFVLCRSFFLLIHYLNE